MEEWREYKLGDVLTIKYGKDHKQIADGDIPIYGSGGIMRYGDRSLYDGPSILIPRKGSLNNIMFANNPFWTVDTMFWTIINKDVANPLFVYYSICKKDFASLNVGSAVPSLTVPVIEDIDILLPSKETQDRVVAILKSLDDKIEVNRRINENLEQQAQALFKSWFVDFEPFKNGEFVESELGMIPKGWRVGTLNEIALINPSRALRKGETAAYLDMKNMPTSGPFPLYCESKEYTGGMRFQNQDTLMARITPCLENGKVAYVNFLNDGEIAFGSTEYIVMTTKNGFMPELLYFLCRDESFKSYATKNMNGSSGRQRVSGETIGDYKIAIPHKSLISPIAPYLKSVMDNIKNNGFESRRLAQLRDTLLPRLMSGELKVNEIENVL